MVLWLTIGFLACEKDDPGVEPWLPDADAATFVAGIDNPYFPLPVGATWIYEGAGADGVEHITVEVQDKLRNVHDVAATVVRDTAVIDGELVEDTWDWFAQDSEGNVWYLGEDTCEYEDGVCVSTEGAWEWGKDGAKPGIVMLAHPEVDGQPYYQEYDLGEAEDVGEVIAVGVSIDVPAGSFQDCITTHDTSTLDPDLDEKKHYCPGVGNVLVEEPDVDVELQEYTGL